MEQEARKPGGQPFRTRNPELWAEVLRICDDVRENGGSKRDALLRVKALGVKEDTFHSWFRKGQIEQIKGSRKREDRSPQGSSLWDRDPERWNEIVAICDDVRRSGGTKVDAYDRIQPYGVTRDAFYAWFRRGKIEQLKHGKSNNKGHNGTWHRDPEVWAEVLRVCDEVRSNGGTQADAFKRLRHHGISSASLNSWIRAGKIAPFGKRPPKPIEPGPEGSGTWHRDPELWDEVHRVAAEEHEKGGTITSTYKRLRHLGVTRSALEHWEKAGKVPRLVVRDHSR